MFDIQNLIYLICFDNLINYLIHSCIWDTTFITFDGILFNLWHMKGKALKIPNRFDLEFDLQDTTEFDLQSLINIFFN